MLIFKKKKKITKHIQHICINANICAALGGKSNLRFFFLNSWILYCCQHMLLIPLTTLQTYKHIYNGLFNTIYLICLICTKRHIVGLVLRGVICGTISWPYESIYHQNNGYKTLITCSPKALFI